VLADNDLGRLARREMALCEPTPFFFTPFFFTSLFFEESLRSAVIGLGHLSALLAVIDRY